MKRGKIATKLKFEIWKAIRILWPSFVLLIEIDIENENEEDHHNQHRYPYLL